jgi:hypothetical protein
VPVQTTSLGLCAGACARVLAALWRTFSHIMIVLNVKYRSCTRAQHIKQISLPSDKPIKPTPAMRLFRSYESLSTCIVVFASLWIIVNCKKC